MKRLAILGAGDLGRQIAYYSISDGHYQPVGFFDDNKNIDTRIHSLPILGSTEDVEAVFNRKLFDVLMMGIGYRHFDLRADLFCRFKDKIPFGSLIHSSSYIDKSCELGSGITIYPGCTLSMNVKIQDNVMITTGCVIGHDSIIGRHSYLGPSVNLAGYSEIGERVFLGVGTIISSRVKLNDCIRTGAGTVVIKNIEVPGLYVGVPASFKKA